MKTIEDRAKLAAEGYEDDGYSAGLYMGYIVGAKEQQYIDRLLIKHLINKAWSIAYSMYQVGRDNLTPLTKDEFCKKMEEEL